MVRVVIMDDAETRLAQMSEEWTVILASSSGDREVIGSWEQSIDSMRREADSLRDEGRWRGGHRTLMHALGVQHREVFLTAGLAWLLDPDGWHGLGSRVLTGLIGQLGLPPTVSYPVSVAVEETRSGGKTRADLVVRMPGVTLLIEAKVYADEQPGQCDRLAEASGFGIGGAAGVVGLSVVGIARDHGPERAGAGGQGGGQNDRRALSR